VRSKQALHRASHLLALPHGGLCTGGGEAPGAGRPRGTPRACPRPGQFRGIL